MALRTPIILSDNRGFYLGKNIKKTLLSLALFCFIIGMSPAARAELIYSLSASTCAGPYYAKPTISGNGTMYIMSYNGGAKEVGAIMKIGVDGSNPTLIYSMDYAMSGNPGELPDGNVLLVGSTLYGLASDTAFKMDTNGSNVSILVSSGTPGAEFFDPHGDFTLYNNRLYATTYQSGVPLKQGIVFSMDLNGNDYQILHRFTSATGTYPNGNVTIPGNGSIYGMTWGGGISDQGVIFKMDMDGTDYTVLRYFHGSDGMHPLGSLLYTDNALYGMTCWGGAGSNGTIFKIDATDGSDFEILHEFSDGSVENDGWNPYGDLIRVGDYLYGLTSGGGNNYAGALFKIGLDGSGYEILKSFSSDLGNDGYSPWGSLTYYDNNVYGVTHAGGANNLGAVFSYPVDGPEPVGDVPEPSTLLLLLPFIGFGIRRLRS